MNLLQFRRRANPAIECLLLLFLALTGCVAAQAQGDAIPKPTKPTPTEILPDIWAITEQVVTVQWPVTLELVNAPADITRLEPGQCIRFGVFATGDDRDRLLESAKYEFTVEYGGETQRFSAEPAQAIKQIKPEGGDFVTGVLGAVGAKNPFPSMASMAASHAHWCVGEDAKDGTAKITGSAFPVDGKSVQLKSRTIHVTTFESARTKPSVTNMETLGPWLQSYYASPDPAQILPALRVIAFDENARTTLNTMQFFVSALKASPVAAQELMRRLPDEKNEVRIYSVPVLAQAGYPTETLLASFKEQERVALRSVRLPDPFDLSPDQTLFQKMDMLWAMFFASGEIQPVRTLASMLAWKDDYVKFEKIREAHQQNPELKMELNDSIVRGVVYSAAGWSLGSLSKESGLLADYIDVFKASPDFPGEAKQLDELYTDAAFKRK